MDVTSGVKGACLPPKDGCPKSVVVTALVKNILAMMDADRKLKPLKELQGCIWRESYKLGRIKGQYVTSFFLTVSLYTFLETA